MCSISCEASIIYYKNLGYDSWDLVYGSKILVFSFVHLGMCLDNEFLVQCIHS